LSGDEPQRRGRQERDRINLAGALAQSEDARVLLVDMDLRRPAIARYLALGESRTRSERWA
jgi:Mrp family chromosome partitioning ATPase